MDRKFSRRPACVERAWMGASALALCMALAGAGPAAAEDASTSNEVVVTGSHVIRNGFSAPTPLTVVGAERFDERAATNIGDVINELPSFQASQTPAAQGLNTNGPYVGGRMLNLRGLDPKRTLVLVDGKRFVPSTTFGTVDTNMIPESLIQRVDVVTGGASAAYGSDAVAGVVNLILDHNLQGLKGVASFGESQRGDAQTQNYSLAGGTAFFGGRGHIVAAAEYEKDTGVGKCPVRNWCAEDWLNFGRAGSTLANVPGTPANNILPDIQTSTISQRGVINTAGPLHGISFTPSGAPTPFIYGSAVNALFMVGGEGQNENGYFGVPIVAPTERWVLYSHANFDLTDSIHAGLDASYGHLTGYGSQIQYKNINTPILRANPYIPAGVTAIMDANAITTFNLGRTYGDIGDPPYISRNNTFRVVASLDGDLGHGWKWDAYYQYGHNDFRSDLTGGVVTSRIVKAINAVTNGAGQIVCAVNADATTANDDPNCVPLNPFGNQVSAAAKAYVTANGFQTDITTEHVVAANLRGEPFSLWAGPVSVGVGGEFRSDEISGDADLISKGGPDNPDTPNAVDVLPPNGFFSGNGSKIAGKVEVTEGYFESLIPLAHDMTFAKRLDVDGAVRRTHYSRSAPTAPSSSVDVTTWKVGVVWEPIEHFRLRGARSEDIRAPNVSELFGPQTSGFGILNDPANGGLQTNPVVLSGSNPKLVPEEAETWTGGLVVSSPGSGAWSRFGGSLDYYKITINQAIGVLGAQTIANRCFQGATEFCSLIVRNSSNVITQITDVQQNVNQLKTSGLDLEISYRQPLGQFGSLDVRMLGNYVWHLITVDSAGPVDRANQTGVRGGTQPGLPRYTLDWLLNWSKDRWLVSFHGKYIPAGRYNALFIGPDDPRYAAALNDPHNPLYGATSNTNTVPAAFYADLTVQYEILMRGHWPELTAFFGVDNLTDLDPPRIPGANGSGQSILFDPVGRSFRGGLRFRY
jgi:outer membrane receptor protein involved in Fe transport